VEPLLTDSPCELANMGEAQTRWDIMDLANNLIKSMIHGDTYIEFCEKRQMEKQWERGIDGERWHNNF
jgi:hypothetical protein